MCRGKAYSSETSSSSKQQHRAISHTVCFADAVSNGDSDGEFSLARPWQNASAIAKLCGHDVNGSCASIPALGETPLPVLSFAGRAAVALR